MSISFSYSETKLIVENLNKNVSKRSFNERKELGTDGFSFLCNIKIFLIT